MKIGCSHRMLASGSATRTLPIYLAVAVAVAAALGAVFWFEPAPDAPPSNPSFESGAGAVAGRVEPTNASQGADGAIPVDGSVVGSLLVDSRFRVHSPHDQSLGRMTSFAPLPTNHCSVELIAQCAPTSGYYYLVATNVSGGTFRFGTSRSLSPVEYSSLLTETLKNGPVFWVDSGSGKVYNEGLVFVTNQVEKIVLVIPRHMQGEFSELVHGLETTHNH